MQTVPDGLIELMNRVASRINMLQESSQYDLSYARDVPEARRADHQSVAGHQQKDCRLTKRRRFWRRREVHALAEHDPAADLILMIARGQTATILVMVMFMQSREFTFRCARLRMHLSVRPSTPDGRISFLGL